MAKHILQAGPKGRLVSIWGPTAKALKRKVSDCFSVVPREDSHKLIRICRQYTKNGHFPSSPEQFKNLEGQQDLYEIKSYQVRLIGFFNGPEFVIVHCVIKKQNRHCRDDLAKAKSLKEQFYEESGQK